MLHLISRQDQKIVEHYDRFCDELHQHHKILVEHKIIPAHQPLPRIIAVSKGIPPGVIELLHSQRGVTWFGENRLTELQTKHTELTSKGGTPNSRRDDDIRWVYLGKVQSKKIKALTQICAEIQSVSTAKHLDLIEKACQRREHSDPLRVMLQVSVMKNDDHSSRQGFTSKGLEELISQHHLLAHKNDQSTTQEIKPNSAGLSLCGLMALPPRTDSRHCFVHNTKNAWKNPPESYLEIQRWSKLLTRCGASELSLGMSWDWKVAVALGATTLRIGRNIFNPDNITP